MDIRVCRTLDGVPVAAWNRLAPADHPFLRHEFLAALETHGAVGRHWGWEPQHLLAYRDDRLVGAVPLYRKSHSFGEFVFDWAWADAYERSGLRYYPKLVNAIPYTPATGPRLLADEAEGDALRTVLIDAAIDHAQALGVSSLHWLFPTGPDLAALRAHGLALREGCQFHWHNRGYADFDDFLNDFTAKKRKNVRQERRRVRDAGLRIERLHGHEVDPERWRRWTALYRATFHRKGNVPTLTEGFFRDIGAALGDRVVLILAWRDDECVAGALCLRGTDTLYGRYWGSRQHFDALHFELCYYQGIEYCIEHGLTRFEPGAQGEHKIPRGFLPQPTWSAHWIADPRFRAAIEDFVVREGRALAGYVAECAGRSPFRDDVVWPEPAPTTGNRRATGP